MMCARTEPIREGTTLPIILLIGRLAALFVLVWGSVLQVQDVSEKPEGIICLQPECDIRKSIPLGNLEAPSAAGPYLESRLRSTSVSVLDPALPEMPFADWLFRALHFDISRQDESWGDWDGTFCEERASAMLQPSADLCIEVTVPVHLNRVVQIVIAVAEGTRGMG